MWENHFLYWPHTYHESLSSQFWFYILVCHWDSYKYFRVLMVCFHNNINYLTLQITKLLLKTQQRKVYYSRRSKRVRVRKGSFWCRRIVCWSLSLLEAGFTVASSTCDCRKAGSSVCEVSSNVFFSEGFPCGMSEAEDVREVCLGCKLGALWLVVTSKKE